MKPSFTVLLYGPKRCGKSSYLRVFSTAQKQQLQFDPDLLLWRRIVSNNIIFNIVEISYIDEFLLLQIPRIDAAIVSVDLSKPFPVLDVLRFAKDIEDAYGTSIHIVKVGFNSENASRSIKSLAINNHVIPVSSHHHQNVEEPLKALERLLLSSRNFSSQSCSTEKSCESLFH